MSGTTYTGRLGSDQFALENELPRGERAIGIRAAHLLCKASVIALGCSILAQPALAQSSVTAQQAGQGFVLADDAATPGALPPAPLPSQAQDKPGEADPQPQDDITVTGSRIITNNLNSPTPITTVNVA
jgi:hypothetical protein